LLLVTVALVERHHFLAAALIRQRLGEHLDLQRLLMGMGAVEMVTPGHILERAEVMAVFLVAEQQQGEVALAGILEMVETAILTHLLLALAAVAEVVAALQDTVALAVVVVSVI
jgi:hypothetical protein